MGSAHSPHAPAPRVCRSAVMPTDIPAGAPHRHSSCGAWVGADLRMKNWLSTWGPRKMSNAGEHLSATGKPCKENSIGHNCSQFEGPTILPCFVPSSLSGSAPFRRAFLDCVHVPPLPGSRWTFQRIPSGPRYLFPQLLSEIMAKSLSGNCRWLKELPQSNDRVKEGMQRPSVPASTGETVKDHLVPGHTLRLCHFPWAQPGFPDCHRRGSRQHPQRSACTQTCLQPVSGKPKEQFLKYFQRTFTLFFPYLLLLTPS